MAYKALSGCGQTRTLFAPIEQTRTQLPLQILDARTDGGLRHMQLFRRAEKIAYGNDMQKCLRLFNIHLSIFTI
jgi:hypothetical protein